jgi:putative membrane protein
VTKLQSVSASAFDRTWVSMNLEDHRKDIKLFGEASQKLDDADARQFAAATLPTLKTHLQLVEQLQQ